MVPISHLPSRAWHLPPVKALILELIGTLIPTSKLSRVSRAGTRCGAVLCDWPRVTVTASTSSGSKEYCRPPVTERCLKETESLDHVQATSARTVHCDANLSSRL